MQQAASRPAVRFAATLPIAELRVHAERLRVQEQLCPEGCEMLVLNSLHLNIKSTKIETGTHFTCKVG